MQIFLLGLFLFIFGCMGGWVMEVFFRRFFTAKKWVNPGFMRGPWLPLYGFGTLLMFFVCAGCITLFPESFKFYNPLGGLFGKDYVCGPTFADLIPISMMWVGMVLLEFLAGIIFIKGFKVKLWDYTNMKGNVMGIICPVFTVIWLFVAVIFYYGVDPFLYVLSSIVHNYMFGGEKQIAHFGFIFFLGLVYGIMIFDFSVSVEMFSVIAKFAKNTGVVSVYEGMKKKFTEVTGFIKRERDEKNEEKREEGVTVIKEKIASIIYIDPEKEKDKSANYDENGRPVKTD